MTSGGIEISRSAPRHHEVPLFRYRTTLVIGHDLRRAFARLSSTPQGRRRELCAGACAACKRDHEMQLKEWQLEADTKLRLFEAEADRRHEEAIAARFAHV